MPDRKDLLGDIIKDIQDLFEGQDFKIVNADELRYWESIRKKYEFSLSVLDLIYKRSIKEKNSLYAEEIKSIVTESLKSMEIGLHASPFDDLRHSVYCLKIELIRLRVWQVKATDALLSACDSGKLDSDLTSYIRSVVEK